MSIKILYVTGVLNRGGAEIMLLDLVKKLSSQTNVHILVNYLNEETRKGILTSDFEELGCEIHYIKTQWSEGLFKYYLSFKTVIKNIGEVDIIHSHINIKSGFVAFCAYQNRIPKIITHSHGEIYYPLTNLSNALRAFEFWFQKKLIKRYSSNYWACSVKAGRTLFAQVKETDIVVINNAIDLDHFTTVNKEAKDGLLIDLGLADTFVIGSVGRVVARKNLLFVIEILNFLNKKDIAFMFLNIGQVDDAVYYARVEQKIKEYSLESKVLNVGLQSEIPLYFSVLDVFISPARNEAFGMVALEAQACGVPVVISDHFPPEVDMNIGLASFMHGFNVEEWGYEIMKKTNAKKPSPASIKKAFIYKGFDSSTNATVVESLYEDK